MALVGDVIISARELIPDMPQTLPSPASAPAAAVVAAAGSTLAAGNYFLQCSFRTPWGETLPSAEIGAALTVGAGQGIQVTAPAIPPSGTVIRVYLTLPGGASGSEQQFVESTVLPFTISTPPPSTNLPSTRNSAWLADGDGIRKFSAGTLYRWLNQGLTRLARKAGGIQDYTAIASIAGQALYVVTGQWQKFTNVWYDGFGLGLGNQGQFYRRNAITSSVLQSCAISISRDQQVLEVYYQPVRTAGATTLSGAMTATDTVANISGTGGIQTFGPPMFAMIGTEIVSFYKLSATQLTGLFRGIGGTVPQAWPLGTVVTELNIVLLGKRLFAQQFSPGNAGNVLPVPFGWEAVLPEFILNKSRKAEQEDEKAARYLKEFDDSVMELLRANRQLAGPTQVGFGSGGAQTVPGFGTGMGGVVLP